MKKCKAADWNDEICKECILNEVWQQQSCWVRDNGDDLDEQINNAAPKIDALLMLIEAQMKHLPDILDKLCRNISRMTEHGCEHCSFHKDGKCDVRKLIDEMNGKTVIHQDDKQLGEVIPGETEICEFDSVTASIVYTGGFSNLEKADLNWRKVGGEHTGDLNILTLDEIVEQLRTDPDFDPQITVVIDDPLSGEILRYGNYNDQKWYRVAKTMGYA